MTFSCAYILTMMNLPGLLVFSETSDQETRSRISRFYKLDATLLRDRFFKDNREEKIISYPTFLLPNSNSFGSLNYHLPCQ